MRDLLQRDPWLVSFSGASDAALQAYPGALTAEVEIAGHHLPGQAEQLDYVTRFGRLYGTRREVIKLRAVRFGADLLALPLHAKVTLTLPRFGLDSGATMRVVGIEADLDARAITFTLWGGAGLDTAAFTLGRDAYTITHGNGGFVVSARAGNEGSDTLIDIERLRFEYQNLGETTSLYSRSPFVQNTLRLSATERSSHACRHSNS